MNSKFIFEGLSKKLGFTCLTILQFIVSILSVYMLLMISHSVYSEIEKLNSLFPNGEYYSLDTSNIESGQINSNLQKGKKIKEYLDSDERIKFFSASNTVTLLKESDVIQQGLVTYEGIIENNEKYMRALTYEVNKELIEECKYTFKSGGIEKFKYNIENDIVPIILGYNYLEKYNVGDIITGISWSDESKYKEVKYEVVGILEKGENICLQGNVESISSLNNSILKPFNEENMLLDGGGKDANMIRTVDLNNYIRGGYLRLDNGIKASDVELKLSSLGHDIKLVDLNESIEFYKKVNLESVKTLIVLAVTVLIFCIISIVIVMINAFIKEKKEFGVNILIGATLADIKNRLLGQVVMIESISFVIASLVIVIISSKNIFIEFNLLIFIETILIMIIVCVIICKIILSNLNKYSINDLIRRGE